MTKFYTEDYGLTAEFLDRKYSPHGDGEHPGYIRHEWRVGVSKEDTVVGYWAWVEHQLQLEREELDRDNPYTQGES